MSTDLVGSPRLDMDLEQGHAPVGTQALEVGQRCLAVQFIGPRAAWSGIPDHDGEIAAGDAASTERLRDALVCGWVNGEEHQARSGRVESMVECGVRKLRLDLREEVVLVRPLCTLGWQTEGLIDHDDVGVSVANIQAHCASSIRQAVTHASWTRQVSTAVFVRPVRRVPAGSPYAVSRTISPLATASACVSML